MFLRFLFMNQSFYISFRLKQRRNLENRKFNLQTHVRSYFSPKQFLQHLFQPGASLPLAVLLFLFSCCNSLHCRPLSWTPLPFDWEVNGKELEKPTEDSSAERKHRWVYSGALSTKSWESAR